MDRHSQELQEDIFYTGLEIFEPLTTIVAGAGLSKEICNQLNFNDTLPLMSGQELTKRLIERAEEKEDDNKIYRTVKSELVSVINDDKNLEKAFAQWRRHEHVYGDLPGERGVSKVIESFLHLLEGLIIEIVEEGMQEYEGNNDVVHELLKLIISESDLHVIDLNWDMLLTKAYKLFDDNSESDLFADFDYGYLLPVGSWHRQQPHHISQRDITLPTYLPLHGSVYIRECRNENCYEHMTPTTSDVVQINNLKEEFRCDSCLHRTDPVIADPSSMKRYSEHSFLDRVHTYSSLAIDKTQKLILAGYSIPEQDQAFSLMLGDTLQKDNKINQIAIFDKTPDIVASRLREEFSISKERIGPKMSSLSELSEFIQSRHNLDVEMK